MLVSLNNILLECSPTYLSIVCGCFYTRTVELSNSDTDFMVHKVENIY